MKITEYFRYLSLKPFDIESEAGRAHERYRLALLTAISSLCSKGIMMLVMFVSVRISLPHLGVERFGVWMTIASLVGLLNFLDFGIGNALTNRVALYAAPVNVRQLRKCIGASLFILGIASVIIFFVLYTFATYLPWQTILKLPTIDIYEETQAAMQLFAILFACNIFTSGINKVFFGLQQGYLANLASALGSVLSLVLIWLAVRWEGGVSTLLLASMLGGLIASLGLLLVLVMRNQVEFVAPLESFQQESHYLIKVGGSFFFLQIGSIVVFGADSLIVANALGVAVVAIYSVLQRLFQFVTQPFSIINSGLWPAYANAHAHDDKAFISATLKRSMIVTVGGGLLLSGVLIGFGKPIIAWWTHGEITVSYALLISFGLWAVCDASANAFSMFLNGVSLMRPQIKGLVVLIVIGMPLKIYLLNEYGLVAMMLGFTMFFVANILFWIGIVYKETITNFFHEKRSI